ncbi:hypothetical protein HDC93_007116 [Streptomyces sp. AK010]|nr:hypothetical protein [Streptomyces sp. AK010]
MTDQLLPQEEGDAARLLRTRLETDGLRVLTGVAAERVEPGVLHTGSGPVPFDRLLVTTGRTPRTTDLGLAEAGVETTTRGHAKVDARLRTGNPRIYAAGDVTELSAFTHLAGVQAAAAVTDALLGVRRPIDYRAVPVVTFTDPEVARVGLTHARARERYGSRARIRTLRHDRVDRAVSDARPDGFTTLVLGPRDEIVGATVVAPRAGETIAHLASAVRLGWTASTYAATVHPHPTYADIFWGLRLYLVCTPAGMPVLWALADPKLGEREVLAAMLEVDAELVRVRPGLLLIGDKGFASKSFERSPSAQGVTLLRPSRKKEILRPGEPILKKVRQLIESVNDTLKGQLHLEQHGGRTVEDVAVRVAQRVLALAAAIWHNFPAARPRRGSGSRPAPGP